MEIFKIFVLTCTRICLPVVADVLFDDPRSLSSIFFILFQYIYSTSTGEFTFPFYGIQVCKPNRLLLRNSVALIYCLAVLSPHSASDR